MARAARAAAAVDLGPARVRDRGTRAFQRTFGRSPRPGPAAVMDLPRWCRRSCTVTAIRAALHVALDDGLYPDTEQSKIRWEGCDGSVIDATTRIPLAAESAASYLRFPSRMAESMQQDQTAAVIWARWPEVRSPFWHDFERIHKYSPVLGRFVTFRQFFEQTDDPGRQSRYEETRIPLPVPDPSRRRPGDRSDQPVSTTLPAPRPLRRGRFLDGLASILLQDSRSARRDVANSKSNSKLPAPTCRRRHAPARCRDAEIDSLRLGSARRLGEIVMHGAGRGRATSCSIRCRSIARSRSSCPSWRRRRAVQPPIRGSRSSTQAPQVTGRRSPLRLRLDSRRAAEVRAAKSTPPRCRKVEMIRNEFIEVYVNEATGGIGRIKQYGRKPNRLSQQLAFRFPARTDRGSAAGREAAARSGPFTRRCDASRFPSRRAGRDSRKSSPPGTLDRSGRRLDCSPNSSRRSGSGGADRSSSWKSSFVPRNCRTAIRGATTSRRASPGTTARPR